AAGAEFDRVHERTGGDVAQRQIVAWLDVSRGSGFYPVTLLEAVRREDVALGAVGVVQQRDARGAVRVIFDVSNLRGDTVPIVAAEVNQAIGLLVSAADVTSRDPASRVTPTRFGQDRKAHV